MEKGINCETATLLISKSHEIKLEDSDSRSLTAHLEICQSCKLFGEQTGYMMQLVSRVANEKAAATLDQSVKNSLADKLRSAMQRDSE